MPGKIQTLSTILRWLLYGQVFTTLHWQMYQRYSTKLDDVLLETNIFGKKIIEQMLNGTHYVRSLRGFIIIGEATEILKWKAFFEQYGKDKSYDFSEIQRLMLEINNKSNENCVSIVDNCIKNIKSMKCDFDQFASCCSRNSEV